MEPRVEWENGRCSSLPTTWEGGLDTGVEAAAAWARASDDVEVEEATRAWRRRRQACDSVAL
jgi:hypothetical protein